MNAKLLLVYLHGMWRRKWVVAAICWSACIAGWIGVLAVHDRYESTARVYVDVDSLLTPLLRGLAVETNPRQQLDYMQRTLLSRPNLEQVIHMADLDTQARTSKDKEQLLIDLGRDIKINLQGQNLFTIAYQDQDPVEAKNIVKAVLTVFSETTAGNNRSEMDNARRFLEEQIANYEKQLRAAETRRAQFRETYADVLPNSASNVSKLDQTRDQVQKLKATVEDAQAKRTELAKQFASTPQYLTLEQQAQVVIRNGGGRVSELQRQLDDSQRKLAEAQSRYTDDFPDIVSLKRDIAAMKATLAEVKKNSSTDSDDSGSGRKGQISNPVYEQLKLKLVDMDGAVASLLRQVALAEADQKRLEEAVKAAPGIELQAQNLDRDYSILKKNYEELIARREAANLAQAADTQADKIQFRVVDSPQVPLLPVAPNRPILYSAVLIVGLGAGLGAAFLLVQLDRSFSGISGLRELGLPVLGSIARVSLLDSRRRTLNQAAGLAACTVALLSVYGVLLAANLGLFHGVI